MPTSAAASTVADINDPLSDHDEPSKPIGRWHRLRPHLPFTALLGLGVLLRVLFLIAYRPAFWFNGDSGAYLALSDMSLRPNPVRTLGYVILLKALRPTGTVLAAVVLQHLLGLLLAVAVYLLLRRRGVATWIAWLAAAPVLFDSVELTLEHYVLAETLFTALLTAAIVAVLWRPDPGWLATGLSGFLFIGAWGVRPNVLPVVAVVGLYLLLRRVGWRAVVAYVAAFALPLAAASALLAGHVNAYGGSITAVNLYARTAMIADCTRLKLPADQRAVCPIEPLDQRPDRADAYIWAIGPQRIVGDARDRGVGVDRLSGFAMSVIRQQPVDFLAVVGKETAAHFVPGFSAGPDLACLRERYRAPATLQPASDCGPLLARSDFGAPAASPRLYPGPTGLDRALHDLAMVTRTGPVVLSGTVLLTLAALLIRRRRGWPDTRDALMLVTASVGMIVATVVALMYEARYAAPALPMLSVAAGLALHQLLRANDRRASSTTPAADQRPEPEVGAQAS